MLLRPLRKPLSGFRQIDRLYSQQKKEEGDERHTTRRRSPSAPLTLQDDKKDGADQHVKRRSAMGSARARVIRLPFSTTRRPSAGMNFDEWASLISPDIQNNKSVLFASSSFRFLLLTSVHLFFIRCDIAVKACLAHHNLTTYARYHTTRRSLPPTPQLGIKFGPYPSRQVAFSKLCVRRYLTESVSQ